MRVNTPTETEMIIRKREKELRNDTRIAMYAVSRRDVATRKVQ
jgi:hypothetical protein